MPAVSLRGGPRPPRVSVSFFADVFEQRPMPRDLAWHALVRRLSSFPLRQGVIDKRRLPCWAPASFRAGAIAVTEAVEQVTLLVLDLDGGIEFAEVLDRCAPFAAVAHTTWSHREHAPCLRLALPLARPIPGDRWGEAWTLAVEALDLPVDRACCNANRRYLLPARPSLHAPHAAEVRDAEIALDLLPLLPIAEAYAHAPAPLRIVRVPHHRVERVVRIRLAEPDVRREVAGQLGATVRGAGDAERAEGLLCPACGRASAWFYVAPHRATRARCKHQRSCGWTGQLTELLARAA